jgi:type III pantothenate kinase
VIAVGNTNIVIGLYDGPRLRDRFRIQTAKGRTADEWGVLLKQLFHHGGVEAPIDAAIIACVVPDLLFSLKEACLRYFRVTALVVGPGTKTGMPILLDNPREVGADRIVNAVAAWEDLHEGCIVVDFGTATTFDVVTGKGEYLGGIIAPGFTISAEALFTRTSKLPRVELERPPRVVGKNTIHAIQSGLFYGYAGLVDGVIQRIVAELAWPRRPHVLATGGLARVVAEAGTAIDRVDDDLTLTGLRVLWERNHKADSGRE